MRCHSYTTSAAKKEDNPEDALKDFQAIVEQEEEKGDWCGINSFPVAHHLIQGQGFQGAKAVYQVTFPRVTAAARRSKSIYTTPDLH